MANPVTHFEVIGEDGRRLREFYSQVFGWRIDANNPMDYGMVSAEAGGIAGGVSGSSQAERRGVTFYVEVASLEEALSAVEQAGGQTLMPPDQVPNGPRIAQFTDPEGHRIGLVERAP